MSLTRGAPRRTRVTFGSSLTKPTQRQRQSRPLSSRGNPTLQRDCWICRSRLRNAVELNLSAAALSAILITLQASQPLATTAALEIEQASSVLKEKASSFEHTIQETLEGVSSAPSDQPQNIFDWILQPRTHGDKGKKEQLAKEREFKQREKEEKKKQERQKQEQERIRKERDKLFRQQAILGGSALGIGALFIGKWQAIAAGAAILFRTIGGPTIMSNVLRTPGLLFGRSLRVVEWDVARSPEVPDGRVVSFKLRALTPVGLRQAIVKNCGLSDRREVKQICHWIQCGPGFCEPLTSVPAFKMLADPSWIVWSRKPRKGIDAIPYRLDHHEMVRQQENPLESLMPQQELELMLQTINTVAALSRDSSRRSAKRLPPRQQSNGSGDNGLSHRNELSQPSSQNVHLGRKPLQAGESSTAASDVRIGRGQAEGSDQPSDTASSGDYEKAVNQAAVARARQVETEQSNGTSQTVGVSPGSSSRADSSGGASTPSLVEAVPQPLRRMSRILGEAAADPVAATRDALGVPTPECQSSVSDVDSSNLPGPSTGGRGAEFREKPSQLNRYQVAEAAIEEAIDLAGWPPSFLPIDHSEEDRLIAAAVAPSSSEGMLQLFRIYARKDVIGFLRFCRAFVSCYDHGNSLKPQDESEAS